MKVLRKAGILLCLVLAVMACMEGMPGNRAYAAAPAISAKNIMIGQGGTAVLKVNNANGSVKWSSGKKSVAAVSQNGRIKAKKKGTAVITAETGGKKLKCNVTVSDGKQKVLVVYFSQTGTTRAAAKKVQKAAGADMIRLTTQKAYTKNYDELVDIAEKELEENARPDISTVVRNMAQYETVYIGYPIWWGAEPMAVRTFLEQHKMSGKTVVPFCTSGGSGISGSMAGIRQYAKGAAVKQGRDLTDAGQKAVTEWIRSIR